MASKSNGPKYSVSELSDGERNALLIAAEYLDRQTGDNRFCRRAREAPSQVNYIALAHAAICKPPGLRVSNELTMFCYPSTIRLLERSSSEHALTLATRSTDGMQTS